MRPDPLSIPPLRPPTSPDRRSRPIEPDTSRVHLLEFVWTTKTGLQPVLYLVRTYLH